MIPKFQAWKLWKVGSISSLIDTRITGESEVAEAMRCLHIGLLCVQELPEDRPSTSALHSMLSSDIVKLPEPKQPAFVVRSSFFDTGTSSSQQSHGPNLSFNTVSMTIVDGR